MNGKYFLLKPQKPERTSKKQNNNIEANLDTPKHVANSTKKISVSILKKKVTNQDFLKKNSEKFYWSRKTAQLCCCPFIGPLDNT